MQKDTCKSNQVRRKAFTLVELLIVIAIIGILFIVLISKVDFASDKAKATGVQTDFRSFQVAIESVAREHAGLNTFGWDTGDLNANGKRDSYDEGDTNKDNVEDAGEVWTGHKVPGETFTKVFTLVKPGTDFATVGYDADAISKLETAINANLDPKLHITINTDGTLTMANGAQDPWNKEYHGWYITNAEVDKKDRGAIIIYSDGANNEFGSEHSIANGVVTVNVPGHNKLGKDDYSIAVVYTFANGYGEVKTSTSGFSNNQTTQGNTSNNIGTEGTEGTKEPDVTELLEPGLYNAGAIVLAENGDIASAQDMMKTSWDELLAAGVVHVTNGVVYSNLDLDTWDNASSDALDGDLVLPNDGSIRSLGDAFYDEDSGDYIGNMAFAYCCELTGVAIPNGVTNIGNNAFDSCENLASITIPDSVTSIGKEAFWYCESLTSVVIPDSVTCIDETTFANCYALFNIVIPNSVETIEYKAFYGCTNLSKIVLGNGVTFIGAYAFDAAEFPDVYYTGTIEEWLNIEFDEMDSNPFYYGGNLYVNNELLTELTIPNGIKNIKNYAFYGCTSLKSVTIPDGVTSISEGAFWECTELTSVTIGNDVTSIGYYAFDSCENLTSVTIPNSVTLIGDYAFSACYGLTSVVIGDSVTEIGRSAFDDCYNLSSIVIPDSVTYIGDWAFRSCDSLSSVVISNSITSIGELAFAFCSSLTSIEIPDSVTSIGKNAFNDCSSLTNVTIGSGVTKIGDYAFYDCSSLDSITFNGSVKQWSSISKGTRWKNSVPATYVQCTDGQATL